MVLDRNRGNAAQWSAQWSHQGASIDVHPFRLYRAHKGWIDKVTRNMTHILTKIKGERETRKRKDTKIDIDQKYWYVLGTHSVFHRVLTQSITESYFVLDMETSDGLYQLFTWPENGHNEVMMR